eukprot:s11151_g2.t1
MVKRDKLAPCDASSELQVRYCLMRRGLALDQAGILTYEHHEALTEKLFQARLSTPPPNYSKVTMAQVESADRKFFTLMGERTRAGIKAGANYSKVTMAQVESADRKFFTLMGERTRAGIKAGAAGRPCDLSFNECLECSEFLTMLQPRPYAVANPDNSWKWRKLDDERPAERPAKGKGRKGKEAKGKGKGKSSQSDFARVPQALLALGCVGMHPQTKQRFCYNFNLKTCSDANCTRGAHVCAVKGCHQTGHAALDCPKRTSS